MRQVHREPWRSLWELLTMLEGFKGEPEEDDGVEEAVQTMGPEDLQKRGKRDGGKGCIGGGGQGRGGWTARDSNKRVRGRESGKKAWEEGVGSSSFPSDPWPGPFVPARR